MEFIELARQRYSVRKFEQRSVEREKIDLILQAAQLAPSAKNAQSQRILVLTEEEALSKLKQCTVCHYNTPLAFLICYDNTVCYSRENDGELSGIVDATIAGAHMMLEAFDIGIGSTWVMNFETDKMKEVFKIPDQYVTVALLVCGYPEEGSKPSGRHTAAQPIDILCYMNSFERKR